MRCVRRRNPRFDRVLKNVKWLCSKKLRWLIIINFFFVYCLVIKAIRLYWNNGTSIIQDHFRCVIHLLGRITIITFGEGYTLLAKYKNIHFYTKKLKNRDDLRLIYLFDSALYARVDIFTDDVAHTLTSRVSIGKHAMKRKKIKTIT